MRHRRWVRWGLLAVPAGLLLWLAIRLRGMDAGDILSWTPRRPLAAALFLLGLYTVKGLTFLFPLSVLQAAARRLRARYSVSFSCTSFLLSSPW